MSITKRQIGLAAVVLFAPGGFILGATLIANHYRKRAADPVQPRRPRLDPESFPERNVVSGSCNRT